MGSGIYWNSAEGAIIIFSLAAIIGLVLGLALLAVLSIIPSNIAKKKGYGAKLFYWFSFLLGFPPALIVALVLPARKTAITEEIE